MTPLLRTSERKDWRRCPWLWEQTWVNGMRPIHPPVWSWFGTAFHTAMEVRYPVGRRRGAVVDCVDAFEAAVGAHRGRIYTELDEVQEAEIVDALELGKIMVAEYCKHYGPESEWEVIHTEAPFQIDVPHPTKPGKTVVVYAGTWDLLAWNRRLKQFWLWDHKTAKSLPNPRYLDLDDQAGSYLWVAKEVLMHKGLMKKKDEIEGIIFNYAKKALPDTRPLNALGEATNKPTKDNYLAALESASVVVPAKATVPVLAELAQANSLVVFGERSAVQPTPRFMRHETYRTPEQNVAQARRVQDEARVMDLQRRGKIPIWKNTSPDCSMCKLFDACEANERGEEWELVLASSHRKGDVYADHREAMQVGGIELPATMI